MSTLLQLISDRDYPSEQAKTLRQQIHEHILTQSPYIDNRNFTKFHSADLQDLYVQYDKRFFDNQLSLTLGNKPLTFSISKRLTKTAGKMTHRKWATADGEKEIFDITLSAPLLFQSFADVDRPVDVNGVLCQDRLQAMQLVFEHELIHLIEVLLWHKSSCKQYRFQDLARRFFKHTKFTHGLVTQSERSLHKFDIMVGDSVEFTFEGVTYRGIVNRITKRATILVESAEGEPYSNGKRYKKFYVPLEMLKKPE